VIDSEERKGSNEICFREDFCSLVQQVSKLERDLHDIRNNIKTIKHNSRQTFSKSYRRDAIVQRKITYCPDIPVRE